MYILFKGDGLRSWAFFKKFFVFPFLTVSLFGFESRYLSGIEIDTGCSFVLRKGAFDVCYSCRWKTPKMATYSIDGRLVDSEDLSRKGLSFRPDYRLPAKCRSYSRDYSRTGFDRGHLAPNAAFDYDRKIQKETFLMSNIAPQRPKLNRFLWRKIERFARMKAKRYGKISVVTGVCGSSGRIRRGVNVPAYWYKIIFLPGWKYVAFLVPNTNEGMRRAKMRDYLVDLEDIEKKCGFGFRRIR